MNNLDWKKKTLEGGSFNAITAIVIENQENMARIDQEYDAISPTYISARDRLKSRSLDNIRNVESLETLCDR